MNMPIQQTEDEVTKGVNLTELLQSQQQSYRSQPAPTYELRIKQLSAIKTALLKFKQPLAEALNRDYGSRSLDDTLISDIMPCINNVNYSLKNLKKWMKPSHRHAGLLLAPAKVKVQYQPVGVVGIIVPWNFPVMLSVGPLITAISAGNRAMLKLSEFTPETNKVITEMLTSIFDETTVAVVEGEADVAAEFSFCDGPI
jgi:coniferyl-aldehyde dehydrogenase